MIASEPVGTDGRAITGRYLKPPVWHAILVLAVLFTRQGFVPLWASVILFKYLSVVIVFWSLGTVSGRPSDIGLHVSSKRFLMLLVVLVTFGSVVFAFREYTTLGAAIGDSLRLGYASNSFERALWILLAVTAGVCEEVIFRGYGLLVLDRKGISRWVATFISSACFSLMHGFSLINGFSAVGFAEHLYLFTAGVFYCVVYRFTKSLIPGIVIHTVYDFGGILLS